MKFKNEPKKSSVFPLLLPLEAMSKSSNAKRAAARFEARKVRSRTRKIRLQQVSLECKQRGKSYAQTAEETGIQFPVFCSSKKKGVRSAKAKLARKALLGNFQKIVG